MIFMDTDHLSVLEIPDSTSRNRLVSRLVLSLDEIIGTTMVNIEEQMRGWIASISKERQSHRQVRSYQKLAGLFEFFRPYHIGLFDDAAANLFDQFNNIRIGTMDRKIAAIAIANNALLLTANSRDFEQVAGLRFENWMD